MKIEAILEIQKSVEYVFTHSRVYIYGAGRYAEAFIAWVKEMGYEPEKVLVTKDDGSSACGGIEEFCPRKRYDGVLILALQSKYHTEIWDKVKNSFVSVVDMPDDLFRDLISIKGVKKRGGNEIRKVDNKITYFLNYFKLNKVVMFQRYGGIGDALIMEPICRKLKKIDREIKIIVSTHYEMLFDYCDSVDLITNESPGKFFPQNMIFISLDYIYEIHPFRHILDSYMDVVKQFFNELSLNPEERVPIYDRNIIHEDMGNIRSVCINVEASGWKSRIYNVENMKTFGRYLRSKGYAIYEIGSNPDNYLGIGENCFDLNFHETVELMSRTDMYIGLDNGLMHLAQSIRLPIFVLFGCVCPLYRIHDWSRARVMWKNVDELSCAGCFHRHQIPCREPLCIHDKCYCLEWSVDEVIYAFENYKYNSPPELMERMFTPLW